MSTLLRVGGAISLLVLGGLTFIGPIPKLIGLPLILIGGVVYGMHFERAFAVTSGIAIGLVFLWLGFRLYPDYANQPRALTVIAVAVAIVLAIVTWQAVSSIRTIDREKREKRDREERKSVTQKLVEERYAAAQRLVEEKNFERRADEPLPPWIQFPGELFFDGLEHFAPAPWDEYKQKVWAPFWRNLTINQRHDCFQHYDLGEQWPERRDWYSHWVTWEIYEEDGLYMKTLVAEAIPETRSGEPVPPWIKYPELDDATCDWHQGKGSEFLTQTFLPFFKALTEDEKEGYLRRHDLGLGWVDRDEWLRLIEWEGDAAKLR